MTNTNGNARVVDQQLLEEAKALEKYVGKYPDFPKPGIMFRDVFPIFQSTEACKLLISLCVRHVRSCFSSDGGIAAVFGLEARGFLLGPLLALELEVPFYPIRKKGKLPGRVAQTIYELEYGQDVIEVQRDHLQPHKGKRVLVVDDLLATGGTLQAANRLLQDECGLQVAENLVVIELTALHGREKLKRGNVFSLLKY